MNEINSLTHRFEKYNIQTLMKYLNEEIRRYESGVNSVEVDEDEERFDMLGTRDVIEVILSLLKQEKIDVSKYERKIHKLDKKLKDSAEKIKDFILWRYKLGDHKKYPEKYWWHHLYKFLKEKPNP